MGKSWGPTALPTCGWVKGDFALRQPDARSSSTSRRSSGSAAPGTAGKRHRDRRGSFDRVLFSYFAPVAGFAGAVDGAAAGEPDPEPVVVAGFVELVLVAGALVWFDAVL